MQASQARNGSALKQTTESAGNRAAREGLRADGAAASPQLRGTRACPPAEPPLTNASEIGQG